MTLANDIIDDSHQAMVNNTILADYQCNECRKLERENRQLRGELRFQRSILQKVIDVCQQAQIDY